ncbi:unnamed protein product [Vicia faba]|uniref:Uncharacterized protein n=1 Tax=Vicia faba TaxID=3906 RepID=A0AAV0YCE6_VICFA|nr:unnamed protein product [Vicia faba]
MVQYFDQAARLVLKSLMTSTPGCNSCARVQVQTYQCCSLTSVGKKLLVFFDSIYMFLFTFGHHNIPTMQLHAVIVIHSLVKNCGLDKISPFGESIIASLLALLKHEKQKLQVEAIDTLKSFAVLMPGTFRQNHYDTTLEGLKVFVFDKNNLPRFLLFAKCLECMVYLVREVGPDNFEEQEVVQVMESVISLEEKLSNTEYFTKCFILKVLDQICRCPRVSIDKYLDKIMPMLLGSAQIHLAFTVDKLKDDYEKSLVETMIVWACNTLSYCAVRSSINFFPNIGKVTALFTRLLGCSSFQIRKASVLGLPNLLLSLKVGDKNIDTKSGLTFFIVKSLIEVLKKETDRVLYAIVWSLLARCIQTSSSYFNDKLIKVIADEIEDTIKMIIEIEITKAQEVETSEGRCESLPTEDRLQGVVILITTTIDTFKDRFMPYVDDLLSNVVVFLADDNSDRLIAFAISIFNVILPLFPDKLPQYRDRYILASCFALRTEYPCSELHATRAIGICAMYGGDQFKASACESILRLYNVMGKKRLSTSDSYEDRDVNISCDTAVAALGKIFEFHHEIIGPKQAIQKWLNFLPLKHDFNEARYAHGLLSKLIQSSDEYLFGSDNENLAKIISIVKEILSGPDRLGSEEAINQMIDFIDQHGGVEVEIEG